MILSDKKITEACEQSSVTIEPFIQQHLQPASYDLGVGDEAARSSDKQKIEVKDKGIVALQPGDFCIVTTQEKLSLDNQHVGRFGLTSSYARRGLIATTGAQIDPGFQGKLVVGLTNLSGKEIILPHHDRFLTVEFHRLIEPVEKPYSGKYQGRESLSPDDIRVVMEREIASLPEIVTTLQSVASSTEKLDKSVSDVSERLDKSVSDVSERLDKSISAISERLDKSISDVSARLDKSISDLNESLNQSVNRGLTAIAIVVGIMFALFGSIITLID